MDQSRTEALDHSFSESDANNKKSSNHWKDIVLKYERRNASLEQRQAQLSERLRAMECALPSMLMSAMVSMHCGTEPPKMDLESILSKSGVVPNPHPIDSTNIETNQNSQNVDNCPRVETVYRREECGLGLNQEMNEPRGGFDPENPSASRFATGDDGDVNHNGVGETVLGLSIMSSKDLIALGRIQELAEQERLLKRYILDLESRERTFCQTLERANRLLNDPLACVQDCSPLCSGCETEAPISNDPVVQRLQKLEFYNKRMITSIKELRQEKNVLVKQTELLKSQLRNTQEKLGEVQKEVLGESKVIPVMTEASFTTLEPNCSCTSTSNKEHGSVNKNPSPKTLEDLAEQFEDVLQKAKNHGLCKLTGTIKDAAIKLKELSKSEETYKCICDCPCDPTSKQVRKHSIQSKDEEFCLKPGFLEDVRKSYINDCYFFHSAGPCPNCKCGKFDLDKFGETGDWVCDSCGGECVCDLVSLDKDSSDTDREKLKNCECGCQDDKIACECGCGASKVNEVGEAGDIPKTVARKVSEDLKEIICKDCGNCKCGDDHSQCPDSVQACTCSCTVTESLPKTEKVPGHTERQLQDPDVCGPRCACNDSDGVLSPENDVVQELRKRFVFSSGNKGNPDLHPCFECEQPEPCDICLEEELKRLQDEPKTIVFSGLQKLLRLVSEPCKECLKFGTKSNAEGSKISTMCKLCQVPKSRTAFPKAEGVETAGDQTLHAEKVHDSECPCSCNATLSPNECLCGCGVTTRVSDEVTKNDSCPCGCGLITKLSNSFQESGCDCECAKGGVHCDYCCCVESIEKFLNVDKLANTVTKSPETCPCIEDSIREAEMENLAQTLQQDVLSIGKKNNLLRRLVAQCACTAPEIIQDSCPTGECLYHDPAPIRPTISGLRAAVELLRVKNRRKDEMIAVLAGNLGETVDPVKIMKNLVAPRFAENSEDFDHCRLYNYLKGSEFDEDVVPMGKVRNGDHQTSGESEIQNTEARIPWSQSLVPAPLDFKVVEQICNDCLLVSWTPPTDISTLKGYEILVNGYVVNRVRSPTRTEALLVSLDLSRPMILTLYSLGSGLSFSDPIRITYPANCPCVQE